MSEVRDLDVAVVGATGAVGGVLLRVLEERKLPVRRLRALASARSAGSRLAFRGEPVTVTALDAEAFRGADLVFFAATGALSREWAPKAVAQGAVVVDKSGTWRMDAGVPLVVPEVNADALAAHRGIVSSPNCTTVGVVMALEPLRRAAGLRDVAITSLQSVSGAGQPGTDELDAQLVATAEGRAPVADVFAAPIAHNVVAWCDALGTDGYTGEETKLCQETRKILDLPDLPVTATCVRVPVPVGHSASVLVETEREITLQEASSRLAAFPGVRVESAEALPTPAEIAGRDEVWVGRLRAVASSPASNGRRLWLWAVSDNLRKGAATNAVQIAEALRERGLL